MLIGLMVVMFAQLYTSYNRQEHLGLEMDWGKEMRSIGQLFALVIVGVVVDTVIQAQSPSGFRDEQGWLRYNVATKSILFWLIGVQILKIVWNVRKTEGTEVIPPVILWFIRQTRFVDAKRWHEHHKEDEVPPRRWVDDLTEEDVVEVLLAAARRGQQPPAPLPPLPLVKEPDK